MKLVNIRVNGIVEPVGYALEDPYLSFAVEDTDSKAAASCKVVVSDCADYSHVLLETAGEHLACIPLDLDLQPRTRYFVKITVTGDAGDSAEAETYFETGKREEPWAAEWIAAPKDEDIHPWISKSFTVSKPVASARLYATGVGLFEAYANGEKLGDEYLAPFNNHYESYIQVLTFPVDLKEGENTLSFLLGKGWYMGQFGLEGQEHNYGDRMAAIGELHIAYEDGTEEVVATDASWTWHASDIAESGIYFGETLDRTLWDGKDNAERPVEVLTDVAADEGTKNLVKDHLADRVSPAVKVMETVSVKEVLRTPAGETVLDMGQNFAGFLRFHADFPKGTKIVLDFGEVLQEDNFYRGNYREANSQYVYVSGGQPEDIRCHFTYFGFRYVKVTGWPGDVKASNFEGAVLYSDMLQTGFLETGNAKVDRLIQNTMWGLKSNFIDMPTDCPQRNERLGWTGDAQVFSPTASYHMDTRAFYHKFLKDLRCEQNYLDGGIPNYIPNIGHKDDCTAVWGDVATFTPDVLYKMFGNKAQLAENYPMMKDWVDWIDRKDAERGERKYLYDFGFQFGDWLALDGISEDSFKGSTEDAYIGSIYYAESTRLVAKAAEILGFDDDAKAYMERYEKIKAAILAEYFTENGRLAADTQASYIIALKFGIYRSKERVIAQFMQRLQKDGFKIRCGFVGAPLLCTVLGEIGAYETAYDFLLNEDFPSWLYCVNLGATTIWERWNSILPDGKISPTGMNSLNHYSYGSVMEFVYAYAAGLRPVTPGFGKAIIAPNPDVRLPKLNCTYISASGKYTVNTEIHADGKVTVDLVIPFGCEAEVTLPRYPGEEGTQTLAAGEYHFEYVPTTDYRKPFDEHSNLMKLAKNEQALGILMKHVPAIGGMAASGNAEFGYNELGTFRFLGFIPHDPDELEQAIAELSELTVTL